MSGAEEPIRFSNPLHGEDDTVVPATDDAAVAPAEADAVAPAEADAVAPAELDAADEPAAATDPTKEPTTPPLMAEALDSCHCEGVLSLHNASHLCTLIHQLTL